MVIARFTLLSFNIFSPTTWITVIITSSEREASKGFAQLRNVSKLHAEVPKVLPNVPNLLRGKEIIIRKK